MRGNRTESTRYLYNTMARKQYNTRLDGQLIKDLTVLAEKDGRPTANLVEKVLTDYRDANKKHLPKKLKVA